LLLTHADQLVQSAIERGQEPGDNVGIEVAGFAVDKISVLGGLEGLLKDLVKMRP
jgi:hypothetical protein